MRWLSKSAVISIHDRQLAEHGGTSGVRDESLLESAIARPQQLYADGEPVPDLAALAAALMVGLARNHAFVDGNKRTATVATEVFVDLNGGELLACDAELYPVVLSVAQGYWTELELADWLREQIRSEITGVHETNANYG